MSNTKAKAEDEISSWGKQRERAFDVERLGMLEQLADSDPDAVYLRDLGGICRFANPSLARFLNAPIERLVGRSVGQFFPQETACALLEQEEAALSAGAQREREFTVLFTQGERPCRVMHSLYYDAEGRIAGVFGRLRDRSEQKRLEREMVETAEREMRRIASDLHDDMCQDLAAVSLIARLLQKRLDGEHSAEGKVAAHIADLTKRLAVSARNLIQNLAPPHLSGSGFVEGLKRIAEDLHAAFPLQCGIEGAWPEAFQDDAAAAHLYRIVQEAMHNAAKHSGGNYITVRLRTSGEAFTVFVSDNGKGFTPDFQKSGGFGLNTMRYRAGIIGGALKIASAPGRGTTVTCKIKLKR